jgi:CubicO group peptidase (beta-lactamase class C family)
MPPASQLANAAAQAVGGLAGVGLATVAFAKLGIDGGEDAAARAEGSVAPGFEPVRELFEEHLRRGLEDRAQCCAFVNGVKVVDLWGSGGAAGGGADGSGYSAGSTQNVFSCTKAITSLVVAMLEDRGHLRYDQEVAELWPEYAQNGKAGTTVAHVMRHEAGLPRFSLRASDLTTERIRGGSASGAIAALRPAFPNESRDVADRAKDPERKGWREYHAITRGWIVNEIVRRADPEGRTIGQIVAEDIVAPLGLGHELFIGSPSEAQTESIEDLTFFSNWKTWRSIVVPAFLGGGAVPLKSGWLRAMLGFGIPAYEIASSMGALGDGRGNKRGLAGSGGVILDDDEEAAAAPGLLGAFNAPVVRRAEIPSANGHASARAMATLAAAIVEGGALGGVRLLSEDGTQRAQGDGVVDSMGTTGKMTSGDLREETKFTNAGWNQFEEEVEQEEVTAYDRDGWTGWLGIGGSIVQWTTVRHDAQEEEEAEEEEEEEEEETESRIGFAFAATSFHLVPTNERAAKLQHAVKLCCERNRQHSKL